MDFHARPRIDPSRGHNIEIDQVASALRRLPSHNTLDSETAEDPLDHYEDIEVVQDSTTLQFNDYDITDNNNLSITLPTSRNLFGDFGEVMEDMKQGSEAGKAEEKTVSNLSKGMKDLKVKSPNGVDQLENNSPSFVPLGQKRIDLPKHPLTDKLRLDLAQGTIDRCSIYSVIHGINTEIEEMVKNDKRHPGEEQQDGNSALVRAVNGPARQLSKEEDAERTDLALIDEETFLLWSIFSRSEDEINARRACPSSFAEAIGEAEPMPRLDEQTANPLTALSSSRTQLWKPSRSWWEAKSGKNPWIEPLSHNKRWRYLWPLIHYHKFLAKCIKKLKRNNVDVKNSLSPVAVFLREEVCAVSDHLAQISKFTAEEWMEGLPHFKGWTDPSPETESHLRELVKELPLKGLGDQQESVDSPLLRNEIDKSYLNSMRQAKEQLQFGAQEQVKNNGPGTGSMDRNRRSKPPLGGAKPPRYANGLPRGASAPKGTANRQRRNHNRTFNGDAYLMQQQHVMPQNPHYMYQPHHYYGAPYLNVSHNGSYYQDMPHDMSLEVPHGWNSVDGSGYILEDPEGIVVDTNGAPLQTWDGSTVPNQQYSCENTTTDEATEPTSSGNSVDGNEPVPQATMTPIKNKGGSPPQMTTPASPIWSHLDMNMSNWSSTHNYPASPHVQMSYGDDGRVNSVPYTRAPFMMNPSASMQHYHTMDNRIPPSPATQFMSTQPFAYYGHQPQEHVPVTYKNNQAQEKSLPSTRSTTPSVDAEESKAMKKETDSKNSKPTSSKEEVKVI